MSGRAEWYKTLDPADKDKIISQVQANKEAHRNSVQHDLDHKITAFQSKIRECSYYICSVCNNTIQKNCYPVKKNICTTLSKNYLLSCKPMIPFCLGMTYHLSPDDNLFESSFFFIKKNNNIYVNVQKEVCCSHQSDRLGYVSRTNQIAALEYVSRTNQSVVFVLWFERCSNFIEVMVVSERAVRKMESSFRMRHVGFY